MLAIVASGAAVAGVAAAAQAERPAPEQERPPATLPRPIVPVAASSLAANPEPYYGETLSVTAAVEEQLFPLAFLVDQDRTKRTDRQVLVIARRLNEPLKPHTYVTVVGQLARFDPEALRQQHPDVTVDLPPALLEQFRGRPVVLATNVVNSAGVDLARRLPPPMTPAEAQYSKTMNEVGQAQAALRKGLAASDSRLVQDQAATLKRAFDQVERFWRTRRRADAASWARQAATYADTIHRAAATARWDAIKTAAEALGGLCQQCHGTYRERFDDGSFRIKVPTDTSATRLR